MDYICLIMCTLKIFSTYYFEQKKKLNTLFTHSLVLAKSWMRWISCPCTHLTSANNLHPVCVWDTAESAYRCVSNTKIKNKNQFVDTETQFKTPYAEKGSLRIHLSYLMTDCSQKGQSHHLSESGQSSTKLTFIWHHGKAVYGASWLENLNQLTAGSGKHQHMRDY